MDRHAYEATFGRPGRKGDFSPLADRLAADYRRSHTATGERVFIWGFEPLVYVLADRRPATRFLFSVPQVFPGAPAAWRAELLRDLRRRPPTYFIVMRNDAVPWASGSPRDSAEELERFPELKQAVTESYIIETALEDFTFYRRRR